MGNDVEQVRGIDFNIEWAFDPLGGSMMAG